MKFFYSPKTLIDLYKNRQKIAEEMSEHQPGWYLSKAGEQAYRSAKTFAQKTNYFYEYLRAISQASVRSERLYKVAFVMAAIDGCSLPYATYPECLSQENNPLVKHVVEKWDEIRVKTYGLYLLKRVSPSGLSFVGEDGEISDMYRLERYIMAAFDLDYQFNEMSEDTAVKVVGDDDDLDDDGDDLDDDDDWDDDEEEEE